MEEDCIGVKESQSEAGDARELRAMQLVDTVLGLNALSPFFAISVKIILSIYFVLIYLAPIFIWRFLHFIYSASIIIWRDLFTFFFWKYLWIFVVTFSTRTQITSLGLPYRVLGIWEDSSFMGRYLTSEQCHVAVLGHFARRSICAGSTSIGNSLSHVLSITVLH